MADVSDALPIFPLGRTVLLPGALLPLHVFEPRYRALLADCLASHRMMGIATLDLGPPPAGTEPDPARPPIHPEIGVGAIVQHQPLPDGRSNLVLQFVARGWLEAELPSPHPYRLVRCRFDEPDPAGFAAAAEGLEALVLQLGTLLPAAASEARRLLELAPPELCDALARRLLSEVREQRAYLGARRQIDRVRMVEDHLATFLLRAPPAATD